VCKSFENVKALILNRVAPEPVRDAPATAWCAACDFTHDLTLGCVEAAAEPVSPSTVQKMT